MPGREASAKPFALAVPDRNRQLLAGSGFGDVEIAEIAGVVRYEVFDDNWAVQSTVSGRLAVMFASLDPDGVTAIQSTLEPMLEPFRAGTGYEIPSLAVAVSVT